MPRQLRLFGAVRLTAHGEIDLGDNRSDLDSDSTTAKTQGNYEKIGLNFSRTQILNDRNSLFFSTNGQYGFKNLDSAEQISLGEEPQPRAHPPGGRAIVRAHPDDAR